MPPAARQACFAVGSPFRLARSRHAVYIIAVKEVVAMRKSNFIPIVIVCCSLLTGLARAQETNVPLTNIEVFDSQTGTIIVKGSVLIGTVSAQNGTVSVQGQGVDRAGQRTEGIRDCG